MQAELLITQNISCVVLSSEESINFVLSSLESISLNSGPQ